jgi:aminomethyltransferase
MTIDSNPFEAGLEKYMDLDKEAEYMCRDALAAIAKSGPEKRLVNLMIEGGQLEAMRADWQVRDGDGKNVGMVTTRVYSPLFESNIAFAIVDAEHAAVGTTLSVDADGDVRDATVRNDRWEAVA